MALQKTPPLGWPHTEAEKYQQGEPVVPKVTGADVTVVDTAPRSKRSCCGVVLFLILLAVAGIGVALAVGIASLDDVLPVDDLTAAEDAFLEQHPGWEVEVSDYPDSGSSTVRLVVWDGQRGIGRLVFMDPDSDSSSIWYERPLVPGASAQSEEALLDAFAMTFSAASWSYIREAEALDTSADPEAWLVWYRVWEEETGAWTSLNQTVAERDATTGVWVVYGPESSSTETTSAP